MHRCANSTHCKSYKASSDVVQIENCTFTLFLYITILTKTCRNTNLHVYKYTNKFTPIQIQMQQLALLLGNFPKLCIDEATCLNCNGNGLILR